MPFVVLLIDDDPALRHALWATMEGRLPDVAILVAASAQEVLGHLDTHEVDLVISDLLMPGEGRYRHEEGLRGLGRGPLQPLPAAQCFGPVSPLVLVRVATSPWA